MHQNLALTAHATVGEEALVVEYEIVNHTTDGVYVYVLAVDAGLNPHPHLAYASLSEDGRVLHLVLDVSPIPQGVNLGYRACPFAYHLKPGTRYTDRLSFELPVREWHAYAKPNYGDEGPLVQVNTVMLVITYVSEGNTLFVEKEDCGYYQVGGHPIRKLTQLLTLPKPVPVLKRTDDFQRFSL